MKCFYPLTEWNQTKKKGSIHTNDVKISPKTILVRFYPSQARVIGEKIVEEELRDQEFDEEDAKNWSLVICDKIRDAVISKLNVSNGYV